MVQYRRRASSWVQAWGALRAPLGEWAQQVGKRRSSV